MALPLFAVTLFVSAFILFLVQPIIGRLILPRLGGAPQVWNTCMVFFQSVLLAGYAYSHYVTTRLPFKRQLIVHALVILLPFLVLLPFGGPFNVGTWTPPPGANPIFSTLLLLLFIVGLPFFAVSTSAPLLQKWFTRTDHPSANDPYFLYSASNVGSLLALVAYPFIIEPIIGLSAQTWTWTVFYVLFVVMLFACVAMLYKLPDLVLKPALTGPELTTPDAKALPPADTGIKAGGTTPAVTGIQKKKPFKPGQKPVVSAAPALDVSMPRSDKVTPWRRVRWVLLAAIPTSLMLGVTTYISVDLSPFPLVWTIPLALYLLSFILVYSKWPTTWLGTPHQVVLFLQPLFLLALTMLIMTPTIALLLPMLVCFLGFFFTALMCHGELARDRPTAEHLTEYFLLMSFGGMLGGVLNGIIAPILFVGVLEFPLAIIIAGFLRPTQRDLGWTDEFVLRSSPSTEQWAIQKSNEYSEKHGQPRTGRPFVFGYVMDVIMGFFVLGLLFIGLHTLVTGRLLANILGLFFDEESMDEVLPAAYRFFVFIVPMIVLFFYAARPYRFGLGLLALLGVHFLFFGADRRDIVPGGAKRTYFGVLRVYKSDDALNRIEFNERAHRGTGRYYTNELDPDVKSALPRDVMAIVGENSAEKKLTRGITTGLLHGTTQHGQNFHWPPQLRRLATTYYHRLGPVGAVMERFNWFERGKSRDFDLLAPDANKDWNPNDYKAAAGRTTGQLVWTADSRLPAAMVGMGASDFMGGLPVNTIANAFSEPPIATIGLGTGTMASYGRPYQHVTFYEIDDQIRMFSEPFKVDPEPGYDPAKYDMAGPNDRLSQPWFTYLRDSRLRGAFTEVIMGDARLSLKREDKELTERFPLRQNYYKVMVIDAFSSDAIPVHLITKEGIQLYLDCLADDGVICVHTSNRHVNLIKPVVDIAIELKLDYQVGKDFGAPNIGHTSSEYVMLARKTAKVPVVNPKDNQEEEREFEVLRDLYKLPGKDAKSTSANKMVGPVRGSRVRWYRPSGYGMRVWTDDYTNMVSIIRWPWQTPSADD